MVTGGAGFIGSHTLVELINDGFNCIVFDNFDNSLEESIKRVKQITKCKDEQLVLVEGNFFSFGFFLYISLIFNLKKKKNIGDLVDLQSVRKVIKDFGPFDGTVHFAGLKAVGESVSMPLHYYYNNVVGTLNLIGALQETNNFNLVFSSSATVYGESTNMPLKETEVLSATNPYGKTKLHIEVKKQKQNL